MVPVLYSIFVLDLKVLTWAKVTEEAKVPAESRHAPATAGVSSSVAGD